MKSTIAFIIAVLSLVCVAGSLDEWSVRPLADDYYPLYRSPDPNGIYVYTPSLAKCPNGRIVATFELGGPKANTVAPLKGQGRGFVYTSDDRGLSWQFRTNFPIVHARAFVAGKSLYVLGHGRNLRVIRSDDWGDTWSEYSDLTENQQWHGTAANVWYKNDCVYLVMERRTVDTVTGWYISELAPVLMRADVNDDLTKRESWTFSNEMTYCDVVNDKELDWFGVPFFAGFYPNQQFLAKGRQHWPNGWLEGNVVQILPKDHYWYDPQGKTFHIFLRAHSGITNMACILKAVEQPDGSIETMFETAPSGKKFLYVQMPGGHQRFHILYDERTKLYWMLGTQTTDSMARAELLPKERFATPDNERRRMQLHFSKNMIDWCFAGIVSIGEAETAARHYACMIIDDDDLLILSRSGDLEATDAHNGNLATFHKIKNFRRLVY